MTGYYYCMRYQKLMSFAWKLCPKHHPQIDCYNDARAGNKTICFKNGAEYKNCCEWLAAREDTTLHMVEVQS